MEESVRSEFGGADLEVDNSPMRAIPAGKLRLAGLFSVQSENGASLYAVGA